MTLIATDPLVPIETRTRAALSESSAPIRRRDGAERTVPDIVDIWGQDSFPASDAPANW